MGEEAFQKKLHSLMIGCIIIGIMQMLSLVSAINSLSNGGGYGSVIISALILLDIVGTYYYTSKKNPIGPVLEYIFGVLLILDGIVMCISILFAIFGIIYIILGVGVLKEANWFQKYINSNQGNNSNFGNANLNIDANGNIIQDPSVNANANPNMNQNPNVNQVPNPNGYAGVFPSWSSFRYPW